MSHPLGETLPAADPYENPGMPLQKDAPTAQSRTDSPTRGGPSLHTLPANAAESIGERNPNGTKLDSPIHRTQSVISLQLLV
jgi:hypothetical protein